MAGFTKLCSQILDSTIWETPWNIKGVWITMLAAADCNGEVLMPLPGLARRATVSLEECEQAIKLFQSPDPYSRTPDNEGRRIEVVDGGWRLLNYLHYRDERDPEERRRQNREAQQRHRALADVSHGHHRHRASADVSYGQHASAPSAKAEAEAEAEAEIRTTPPPEGSRGAGKKKPQPKADPFAVFTPEVREAVNAILARCPECDSGERTIRRDVAKLAARVAEIMEEHPRVTPPLLVQSWTDYLAINPTKIKAPHYFFGKLDNQHNPNAANWFEFMKLIFHNRARAMEAQAAPPQPPNSHPENPTGEAEGDAYAPH